MGTWTRVPAGAWIFLAADQLTPGGRALAKALADQLMAGRARVLNHPGTALCRFALLTELHNRGMNKHRAVRADADFSGLRYPVFLREEHRHSGNLSELLHSPGQVRARLALARLDGYRPEDLLIMEFLDTPGPDRMYRKYSAFILGDRIMARALERGRDWMVKHADSDLVEASFLEERGFVQQNPHRESLRPIFEIANVEYGRIDYAVLDGVIETWEINLHPTIGRRLGRPSSTPPEARVFSEPARQAFYTLFQAAWEAIDPGDRAGDIPIDLRNAVQAGSGPLVRGRFHRPGPRLLRQLLHPLRPLIDGLVNRWHG
jgi:hypothetical protein